MEDQMSTRWTYSAPTPPDPSPLLQSVTTLSSALPQAPRSNSYQHTLQALSDFTGYISTQIYQPFRPTHSGTGFHGMTSILGPAEEEFKREVRALKGLVLNLLYLRFLGRVLHHQRHRNRLSAGVDPKPRVRLGPSVPADDAVVHLDTSYYNMVR
jgi:hypothetical protein